MDLDRRRVGGRAGDVGVDVRSFSRRVFIDATARSCHPDDHRQPDEREQHRRHALHDGGVQ
jgi:hypothetical protein